MDPHADFWSLFPGLPREAVIEALRIIDYNEWPSTMSKVLEVADREARDDARDSHERHLNLLASCYLCRIEAGPQTDRLSPDDDATCTCGHTAAQHQTGEGAWTGFCSGTLGELGDEYMAPGDDPNESCECERFVDVEAVPDIHDPAWPGYAKATEDVLVAPPNAKRVGA